jgi:hypothetical protein
LGRNYKEKVFQTARFDFLMALPWWTLLITVTSGHLRTLQDNKEIRGDNQRSDGTSTGRNSNVSLSVSADNVSDLEKLINKQKDKKTNSIMLVEANSGFHPMLISWLAHIKQSMITSYLIVALDQKEYDLLCSMGEPVALSKGRFEADSTIYRNNDYNKIVRNKWSLIASVLGMGVNVLISDIDVVWYRDPLPGLSSTSANCGMLFSSNDQNRHPHDHIKMDPLLEVGSWMNTGVSYLRSTKQAIKYIDAFLSWTDPQEGLDDQANWNHFRHRLRENPNFTQSEFGIHYDWRGIDNSASDECHVESTPDLTLSFHMLPRTEYMDYKHYHDKSLARYRKTATSVHYCWLNGLAMKAQAMNEDGQWLGPKEPLTWEIRKNTKDRKKILRTISDKNLTDENLTDKNLTDDSDSDGSNATSAE